MVEMVFVCRCQVTETRPHVHSNKIRIVAISGGTQRDAGKHYCFVSLFDMHVLCIFTYFSVAPKLDGAKKRGRPRKSDTPRKGAKTRRKSTAKRTSQKVTDRSFKETIKTKMTPRTYSCAVCTRSFNHKSVLSLHRKEHSKVLVNALLVKSFLQARLSNKFTNLTLVAGGHEIQCDKCSRVFPLYCKWIRHYTSKHLTHVKCKNCDRTFTSHLTLRQHCVRKHKHKLLTSKVQLRRFKIHCQRLNLDGKSKRTTNSKKGR